MKPVLGETNLGAVVGVVVGAVGGLLAVGIAPAILARNPALLFGTPTLAFGGWVVCGPLGWLLGGQIGPRLSGCLRWRRAEAFGGAVGGLIPVSLLTAWSWYVTIH